MRRPRNFEIFWLATATLALALILPQAASSQGVSCLPTCAPDDGRFLVVTDDPSASLLDTLSDNTLEVQLEATSCVVGEAFSVGVFDGDTGGLRGQHWDFNFGIGTATVFTLYADPDNNGTGTFEVFSFGELDVLDNAWVDFVIANAPEAYNPMTGSCYYRLRAELLGPIIPPPPLPAPAVTNSLKFRTSENVSIELFQLPFSFIAAAIGDTKIIDGVVVGSGLPDFRIIYPVCAASPTAMDCYNLLCPAGPGPDCDAAVKDPANTTYDGSFSFLVDIAADSNKLTIWDGDFDRGKWDGTESDTDDDNSPFDPTQSLSCFLPPGDPDQPEDCFFPNLTNVNPEGVAIGTGPSTGAPSDDTFNGSANVLFLRTPSIRSDLLRVEGDGSRTLVASNENPSGNREWEKFRVQTPAAPPDPDGPADAIVPDIPAGIYEVRIDGLDLQNLNALRVPIVGQIGGGQGCTPGYWKQRHHFGNWIGYAPEDSFEVVFGVDVPKGSPTLLDALKTGGGGYKAFNRHAVAALLNAASAGVDYPFGEADVIGFVQQAYATGEFEMFKDILEEQNETYCPLGRAE